MELLPLYGTAALALLAGRVAGDVEDVSTPAIATAVGSYALFFEPAPLRPLITFHPAILALTLVGVVGSVGYYVYDNPARGPTALIFTPLLLKAATIGLGLVGVQLPVAI